MTATKSIIQLCPGTEKVNDMVHGVGEEPGFSELSMQDFQLAEYSPGINGCNSLSMQKFSLSIHRKCITSGPFC